MDKEKILADEIFTNDSPPAAKCRSCGEFVFVGVRCPHCGKILGRKISDGDIEYYCSRCKRDIRIIVRVRRESKGIERSEFNQAIARDKEKLNREYVKGSQIIAK